MSHLRQQLRRIHWWYLVLRYYGETPASAVYWAMVIVLIPEPDSKLVA